MLTVLLLSTQVFAAANNWLSNTPSAHSSTPCANYGCLSVRDEPVDWIFPPWLLSMAQLSGTASFFDVEMDLWNTSVVLEATLLENGMSAAAYGDVDLDRDGVPEEVGVYLDYTSAGHWNVYAAFYNVSGRTPTMYGTLTAQLNYSRWGSSTIPVYGWELANVSATIGNSVVYQASNTQVSFDALLGGGMYYENTLSQSNGVTSTYEYLDETDGTAEVGFYRTGTLSSTSASVQDGAWNYYSSVGNYSFSRSTTISSRASTSTTTWVTPHGTTSSSTVTASTLTSPSTATGSGTRLMVAIAR